jgi:hypothetical protein
MEKIVNLDNVDNFEFSKLSLLQPSALQGGSYFTKLRYVGEPLYFQSPKLFTRNGIVETNKTNYLDLLFTNDNESFIAWLENLETHIQKLIYEKRNLWFNNELELSDIESAFTSSVKPYRGGKFFLVRSNILKSKLYNNTKPSCLIFDEHENTLEFKDITPETKLITIIDVQGVKFSSKNFQIELVAKQIMVMNNKYEFDSCVIKVGKTQSSVEQNNKTNETSTETSSEKMYQDTLLDNEEHSVEESLNEEKSIDAYELENHNLITESIDGANIIESKTEKTHGDNSNKDTINLEEIDNKNSENDESNIIKEIDFKPDENMETMILKKPNDVYYEIYKIAKEKAKNAKKKALEAFLEVKKIKNTYLLTDLDDSDSDDDFYDDSDYSENDSDEEEKIENHLDIEKLESI